MWDWSGIENDGCGRGEDAVLLTAGSFMDRIKSGLDPGHEAALVKGEDPRLIYEAELQSFAGVLSEG